VLDVAAIRALLPHAHPIALLDRVLELDSGTSIVATKAITVSEPCYRGLAADARLESYEYPASLLLESFGQAAALLWLLGREDTRTEDRVIMLVAGRNCRIEGRALPGDVLRHVARIFREVGDTVLVEGETYVDDRRVASVESMMATARPRHALYERPPADHAPS
jgi:3-hydroxyacyl-[acyl-carrier-protein] dehydratase